VAKLRVKKHKGIALQVHRLAIKVDKLVYVLLTNKKLKYRYGRCRVAYIGTTKKGARRIMQSAANKAGNLLEQYGIKTLEAHIVTCQQRPGVETWKKLERALLLEFRSHFGEVPKGNNQGQRIRERDEFRYFQRTRIRSIVVTLG
jgi:hypothetical protein